MRKYLSSQIGNTLELSQVLINRLSETKVFMSTFVWMTVDNIRFTMSNTDKKIRFARRKKSFLPLMKKSVWIRMQNLFFIFWGKKRNFKSSTYFFLSVLFRRRAWIRFHSVEIWKFCKSLKIVHDHNHSVFTTEFLKHFNCILWLSNNN
jgi:hypothetical protein